MTSSDEDECLSLENSSTLGIDLLLSNTEPRRASVEPAALNEYKPRAILHDLLQLSSFLDG